MRLLCWLRLHSWRSCDLRGWSDLLVDFQKCVRCGKRRRVFLTPNKYQNWVSYD